MLLPAASRLLRSKEDVLKAKLDKETAKIIVLLIDFGTNKTAASALGLTDERSWIMNDVKGIMSRSELFYCFIS